MRLSSLFLYAIGFLILFVCFYGIVNSQPQAASAAGAPWTGQPGVTRTTAEIMSSAALAAPKPAGWFRLSVEHEVDREDLPQNGSSPLVPQWPPASQKEGVRIDGTTAPQTLGLSFTGSTLADESAFPPDCMGTVGPTQFIVAVNGRIRSFNKATGAADGVMNFDTDVFFTSVMTPPTSSNFTSDPRIRYDRLSGKWFIIMIDVPGGLGDLPNRVMIAVSSGGTITGSTVWTYYFFQHDQVSPAGDTKGFADYPTLGIDVNALYIGVNVFDSTGAFSGTTGFVVRKSSVTGGGPIVVTAFRSLTSGSPTGAGPYTPQGVDNFDPAATVGYFIGVDNAAFGLLEIRRVTNPGGSPTISANIPLTVPATVYPVLVPHLGNTGGSNGRLDALDDRLMSAVMRNGHIWASHNIGVNSSGVAASANRDAARWYEISNVSSTPALVQSGTVYDPSTPNDANQRNYWIPTLMVSGQGHVGMGFSTAGTNARVNTATIGRLSSDAAGSMQGTPVIYTSSATAYNPSSDPGGANGRRWGDYSYTSVDPNDDMTMWTIQQFCDATNSYGVRAVKLIAPPPAAPTGASPSSVSTGSSNVNVVVTGTSTTGSGFFDPGAVFSNRISASVGGTGVTVNSITYTDPTHITLNINVAGGAAAGARTITVMNPDSQSVTSASAILTVTASGCPTITLAPPTLPGGTAGSAYSQLITSSGGISPYTYSVIAGALPSGTTLSAGGLLAGAKPHGGTYNFTIQASDSAGCTGSHAYAVTISCPAITVSPATLPDDTAGIAYSQPLSASGGAGGYTFAVTSGTLPAGLTLTAGGLLSGTPTTPGASSFVVTSTDSLGCTGTQSYSVTIFSGPVVVPAVSLNAIGAPVTQNFNTLASTGTGDTNSLPLGWTFHETATNANGSYTAGTGSGTAGDTYSFGAASDTERAFGTLQSGNLVSTIGAAFKNNTGTTITSLAVSYNGEEWRLGTTGRVDTLIFQTSLDATSLTTGTWTTRPALSFPSPLASGTVGAINGNVAPNRTAISSTITGLSIPNGAVFFFRWNDFNASGADDGLAVDDFSITPLGGSPTNPTAAGSASPDTLRAGLQTLLVVTVTPGTLPVSSGIAVTAALDSIGGLSAQMLYDDGSHGDATPADNKFSFLATVNAAVSAGVKRLPVSVTDAEARSGADTIAMTVLPACPAITLSPDTLPFGTAGTAYGQQITASGGISTYTFTVIAGALPGGMTLSPAGLLSAALPHSGAFSFTIQASDSAGCIGTKAYALTIGCPSITAGPPALPSGMAGSAYAETLQAAGGTAPYTFTLSGGQLPSGLALSPAGIISGIPAAAETTAFTVTASDSTGCSALLADTISIVPAPGMTLHVPVAARWNILSNPLATADTSVDALYPGRTGNAFGFDGSSYAIAPGFSHGRGYWMKFAAPETSAIFGAARRRETIGVSPGWNLIGSISAVLPASGVTTIGTTIRSHIFGYAGSYLQADSLRPGLGYWLKVDSAGSCVLGTGSASAAMNTKRPEGLNVLVMHDAAGYEQTLYFAAPGAGDAADAAAFELPPPPPAGVADARFASNSAFALVASGVSARIVLTSLVPPVEVDWSVAAGGAAGFVLHAGGTALVLTGEGKTRLGRGEIASLTLGAHDPLLVPKAFALYQNYPNPFNPATSIRFDLPEKSSVTLAVFNVLGERVGMPLENALLDGGSHAASFDAAVLPSGIYYYRLTALSVERNTFTSVRKMMVVK